MTKFLAFGDSFVKMFIHCSNVRFYKFKGKSLCGLVKLIDSDRARIKEIVDRNPNWQPIFMFGQVDLNFVRYFKVTGKKSYCASTFKNYVEWVASLSAKSVILGIFPSPISR
jgi:hypothetical protein